MKQKIAIVNQRFGEEVNGGSEYYTRLIAEKLSEKYDIEILTTTALDYNTWANYYQPGVEQYKGMTVRRFKVDRQRNRVSFRVAHECHKLAIKMGMDRDRAWIDAQGPKCDDLITYIDEHQHDYAVFLFVTYLYYTTAVGILHAEKCILIPTAHDEPYIYYSWYRQVFHKPKAIVFLTEEERDFIHGMFRNQNIPNKVLGVGIDLPTFAEDENLKQTAIQKLREKYQISGNYIIYAGRVDRGKGCDEMFSYFERYKKIYPDDTTQLVVIGKDNMGIPDISGLHYLGFVSEEEKYAAIAGAQYLWLPSHFESLSIALLEAMALSVPGIVSGQCEVLKGHCEKSNAGVYYQNEDECLRQLEHLLSMPVDDYQQMRENAHQYIRKYYRWDQIVNEFETLIETVISE